MCAKDMYEARTRIKHKGPSDKWRRNLMKRYGLTLRKPNQLDRLRSTSTTEEDLKDYFERLEVLIK